MTKSKKKKSVFQPLTIVLFALTMFFATTSMASVALNIIQYFGVLPSYNHNNQSTTLAVGDAITGFEITSATNINLAPIYDELAACEDAIVETSSGSSTVLVAKFVALNEVYYPVSFSLSIIKGTNNQYGVCICDDNYFYFYNPDALVFYGVAMKKGWSRIPRTTSATVERYEEATINYDEEYIAMYVSPAVQALAPVMNAIIVK